MFFRPIKKNFSGFSGGKDSTPAKFQLDRFITVGGVDGQTHTQTHIPGPYVNYSKTSRKPALRAEFLG